MHSLDLLYPSPTRLYGYVSRKYLSGRPKYAQRESFRIRDRCQVSLRRIMGQRYQLNGMMIRVIVGTSQVCDVWI